MAAASEDERLIQRLRSQIYYGPMLKGEKMLGRLLNRYLSINPLYRSTIARRDIAIIFTQHTGAALATAAVALANDEHPAFITKRLVKRIGKQGGRPSVKVSVSFQLGNQSVAHGFRSQQMVKNERLEQNNPFKKANVQQHFWDDHVLIHNFTGKRKKTSDKMPLAPLDITSPSICWTGPSITQIHCGVNVIGQDNDALRSLREMIKMYPIMFLSWCVLKGSTLA
nr:MAG: wsv198-like protein [Penaeus semisulcatus pemonivirus]